MKVMDTSYAEGAGIKSATFEIDAPYAFGTISVEAGTHRLARISPFGSADKRQTSFAAVDATDFAEMLMRMYLRWAERHKYPVKVMDTSYAEGAGIKSATFEIDAPYAFGTISV
ncbi:hypothetical protein CTI14_54575, partial [Methylobacterium radiotolerans]